MAGVYATTSRRRFTILADGLPSSQNFGDWVQVARQGNPLFNEGLVALEAKDLYSRTTPASDKVLFRKYAEKPELATLLNLLVLEPDVPGIQTGRTDIAGIFIPDVIKVDLSTKSVRLAGGGPMHPTNPDDPGFSRLSIFGGDVLVSQIQPGFGNGVIPGGWPNGRRFGDDVVDIAVTALISDLRTSPPIIRGPGGRQRQRERHGVQQGVPVRVDAAERPPARPSLIGWEHVSTIVASHLSRAVVLVTAALALGFPASTAAHDPGLSALDVHVLSGRVVATLSLSRGRRAIARLTSAAISSMRSCSTPSRSGSTACGCQAVSNVARRKATPEPASWSHSIGVIGSRLTVRSNVPARLARGHRELLTVRGPDGALLAERMLDDRDSSRVDLASRRALGCRRASSSR